MHWKPIDANCSVPQKSIAPRISMIVAVSSHGDVWVCLSHSNSNKSMMGVFVEKLCLKLDQQNPHWRNTHILTWDGKCRPPGCSIVLFAHQYLFTIGAPYHRAAGTKKMLERLQVPIMMSGPYSYDLAPAELFFAEFKKVDVNPSKVPMSKTHFDTVLKLVVERCQQIKKEHLVLNWHHSLLYAYKFLMFHRV